eukprot:Blabericola_migrator_1__1623@NODE_1435_length_4552_cov_77_189967_g954_i0_p5_GENE_NODE_1435_length_4552_cov_77_189967_g954_i0NODE_1435_length_4552_cov_77_189967_g954_i0_p5_ORF_typecomplete_len156_score12_00CPW_WPC/PF09717_10/0_73CPW_WPC/PF09717_10/2_4e07_NODE_1435_length_4552_cov_77_189967_g954_i021802647
MKGRYLYSRQSADIIATLKSVSAQCGVQWPCRTHSGLDLEAATCPLGWSIIYQTDSRLLCMAPNENRRCGILLEVTNMTAKDRSRWAHDCEEVWDMDPESAKIRLKEKEAAVNEQLHGSSKWTPYIPSNTIADDVAGPFSYVHGQLVNVHDSTIL